MACDALARVRAGAPLEYGYTVYGTGRVTLVISWDPAASTYVEMRTDHDLTGSADTSTRPITAEEAARHVRAAAESS